MTTWLRPLDKSTAKFLPESDAQNNLFSVLDEFPFGILNVRKGQKRILPDDEYQIARQAKVRLPKVPSVRIWLELAIQWEKRLHADPDLTRTALAKELGISPTRLIHILNLLKLAPEIKERILTMVASMKRGSITENRLRRIARLKDPVHQLSEFARLK